MFVAVFLPLFIGLGFWQLQRAEEKREIGAIWQQRQGLAAVPLLQLDGDAAALTQRRVWLEGRFLHNRDFLLDNKIQGGQYGYEVLSPFRLPDGLVVLVNRGWIAGDSSRRSLPRIPPTEAARVEGTVYVSPGQPYRLGEETLSAAWPQQMLSLDMPWVEQTLGEPIYPYTVRLNADSQAALQVHWPVVNVSPEKHTGYAVQWFSMAAALLLIYLIRSSNVLAWLGLVKDKAAARAKQENFEQ